MNNNVTAIILTFNEEKNIKDCILSLKDVCREIFVIDSFSTDKTVEIALGLGAKVLQNKWINHSKQFQYGLDNIKTDSDWLLRIDADERMTDASRKEMKELIDRHLSDNVNGIYFRFEVTFLGKKLRHGGIYPFKKLVLFKKEFGRIEDKNMDEHIYLTSGKTISMQSDCLHCDYKDVYSWIDKHNKYSSKEVIDYYDYIKSIDSKYLDNPSEKKQKIKFNKYYKMPMFFRAKLYYLYRLIIKGAWLDGREGKIFAFLQAYWYRYLVDVKIFEKKK